MKKASLFLAVAALFSTILLLTGTAHAGDTFSPPVETGFDKSFSPYVSYENGEPTYIFDLENVTLTDNVYEGDYLTSTVVDADLVRTEVGENVLSASQNFDDMPPISDVTDWNPQWWPTATTFTHGSVGEQNEVYFPDSVSFDEDQYAYQTDDNYWIRGRFKSIHQIDPDYSQLTVNVQDLNSDVPLSVENDYSVRYDDAITSSDTAFDVLYHVENYGLQKEYVMSDFTQGTQDLTWGGGSPTENHFMSFKYNMDFQYGEDVEIRYRDENGEIHVWDGSSKFKATDIRYYVDGKVQYVLPEPVATDNSGREFSGHYYVTSRDQNGDFVLNDHYNLDIYVNYRYGDFGELTGTYNDRLENVNWPIRFDPAVDRTDVSKFEGLEYSDGDVIGGDAVSTMISDLEKVPRKTENGSIGYDIDGDLKGQTSIPVSFSVDLEKESESSYSASAKLGSNSATFSVSSETDWYDDASSSEVDVRTTVSNGALKLIPVNAQGAWSYDDDSDPTEDLTSHNRPAELINGANIESGGRFSNLLNLDQSNDEYARVDETGVTWGEGGELTFVSWIRLNNSSTNLDSRQYIMRAREGWGDPGFGFGIRDTNEWGYVDDDSKGSGGFGSPDLDADTWYLLCVRWDGNNDSLEVYTGDYSTGDFYLNDSESEGFTPPTDVPLDFGSREGYEGGYSFDGEWDETMFFNSLLSEEQMERIFNRISPSSMTGSVLESGTWTSILKDMDTSDAQSIDSFDTTASISSGESVDVRVGVDEDDDGDVEQTGDWTSLSDGSNSLSASDLGLEDASGHRFQVEYDLSTDDTTSSPSVSDYDLTSENVETNSPPVSENHSQENITRTSADLASDVYDLDGDDLVSVAFVDDSDGSVIENFNSGPYSSPKGFSTMWDGLDENTTYEYTVIAEDNTGMVGESSVQSFTTEANYLKIESVTASEGLIDRDDDGGSPVLDTTLTIRVVDNDGVDDISRVNLWIRDNSDSNVVDNLELTNSTQVDENTLEYSYTYDPPADMSDDALGDFDTQVTAKDSYGKTDSFGWDELFVVDDYAVDPLIHPLNARLGLAHGFDYYAWAHVDRRSGVDADVESAFLDGSSVSVRDYHVLDSMEEGWSGEGGVSTDWYTEGSGSWKIRVPTDAGTYTYTATKDFNLTGIDEIRLDVKAYSASNGTAGRIYVGGSQKFSLSAYNDDQIETAVIDVSGYSGTTEVKIETEKNLDRASVDTNGTAYFDNMCIEAKILETKTISVNPGEGISHSFTATGDGSALDGGANTSFTVNENRFVNVNTRWEENFEMLDAADVENYEAKLYLGTPENTTGTEIFDVDSAVDNFVVKDTVSEIRIEDTANTYYRTYRVTETRENLNAYMVGPEDLSKLTQYTFELDDPSGIFGPPEGWLQLTKYRDGRKGTIVDKHWTTGPSSSVWMIFDTRYNMYLEGPSTEAVNIGAVDADSQHTKTVRPYTSTEIESNSLEAITEEISWSAEFDNEGNIDIFYTDDDNETRWVWVGIYYQDNLQYSENVIVDSGAAAFTWTGADENRGYTVRLKADHATYGASPVSGTMNLHEDLKEAELEDLPAIGTLTLSLMVFGLSVVLIKVFGPDLAGLGILSMATIMVFIQMWGLIDIGWPNIALLGFIGVMVQIILEKKRGS